jgi:ribosomal protein S18 acetylase RimI-like enzyme
MQHPSEVFVTNGMAHDLPTLAALWNQSAASGETVFSPLDEAAFASTFFGPEAVLLIARCGEETIGFIHGTCPTTALPTDSEAARRGYLTAVLVAPRFRRAGVGGALLRALEQRLGALGRRTLVCSGNNPTRLSWRVPGTPGHDHNNAPGVDENCPGYLFLLAHGLEPQAVEIAMYRDLRGYAWPERLTGAREELGRQGVYTGRYDGVSTLEFDGMCDRVGSDYWRHVLRQELAAWRAGEPCAEPALWADGRRPTGPRPLLVAVHGDRLVGFTGPVDLQRSGRGWFCGICVDPLYGHRSIGEVLFNLLMTEFVAAGAAFTTLFTEVENHAQRMYARAGLAIVRRFAVMTKAL